MQTRQPNEAIVVLGTKKSDGSREFRVRNVQDLHRLRPEKKGPLNWRMAFSVFRDAQTLHCQERAINFGHILARSLHPGRDPEVICITLDEPFLVLH